MVPIRESVGAALRFSRENLRFIAIVSAVGAAVTMLLALLGMVPPLGLFSGIGGALVQAFAYAIFTACALFGASAVRARWAGDGWRVFAAMAVVGFFLFIVFFVLTIPALIILFAGPLAPYVDDLQEAGSSQAAVMEVMTRFAQENPGALLGVTLFYAGVWLLLSSRLYLAAPATVDHQRILTFETWAWTRGSMLRIAGARVLLLLPAYIFVGALSYLAGRAVGIDTLNPGAAQNVVAANPFGFAVYLFVATFISFALYYALEAGLSAYLYRGLKPAERQPPVA
jgi:hypothetical protein